MTITKFISSVLVAHEMAPPAPGVVATSASSLTIGTGSKTLLTQAGTAFRAGQRVRLVHRADPTIYMEGDITAYEGASMTVYIADTAGAGTFGDWDIVVAGKPGAGDVIASNNGLEFEPRTFMTNFGYYKAPMFDVYTGQSNSVLTYADGSIEIPSNLFWWNWNGTPGSVGTAFVTPPQEARWALAAAIRKARAEPLRDFYVMNIGYGSQPIEQWVPSFAHSGDGYYDMAAALEDNIAAGLAVLASKGITTISNMHWWGGESNAYAGHDQAFYKGLMDQLHLRWRGFSWFPERTPIYAMSFNPFDPAFPKYSRWMQEWCDAEYQTRHFVDTSILKDPANWDPVPHMSASGYKNAGGMLAEAQLGRTAQAPFSAYYKSGTFTPTVALTTPGDFVVNYSIQVGRYVRIGSLVFFTIVLVFVPGPNPTTGSGPLVIGGLPFNTTSNGYGPSQVVWNNITKAGYTDIGFQPTGATKTGLLRTSGSGLAGANVEKGDIGLGLSTTLLITGHYETDDWFGA